MTKSILWLAGAAVALPALAAPVLGGSIQLQQDDPVFRLLTAPTGTRFDVAAEILLKPDTVATEEIRRAVSVPPLKYLFRASKNAQAALDFVLLKRDGGAPEFRPTDEFTRSPNVVLVSIGGPFRDAIAGVEEVSSLSTLAAAGVSLGDAYATSPDTVVSNASLLTSLDPAATGVDSGDDKSHLRHDRKTLATALQEKGYDTGAILGDSDFQAFRGFARGFDSYSALDEPAAGVSQRARLWLEWHIFHAQRGLAPVPYFLFVQLSDLDRPLARVSATPGSDRAVYTSRLRAVDEAVGALLDDLATLGLDGNNTAVVVVGSGGHASARTDAPVLAEARLRVPIVFRFPGTVAAGAAVGGPVSTVDVMPTILGWVDAAPSEHGSGRSLAPMLPAPGESPKATIPGGEAFASATDSNGRQHAALIADGWKAVVAFPRDGRGSISMYNLGEDPAEAHDLAADPSLRDRKRDLVSRLRERAIASER